MLNKVSLLGRVGRDLELRATPSGKSYAFFSLATTHGFGDKAKTEWHNCVVWDKLAETCSKFVKKGSKIYAEGRIESYENKEKQKVTQIVCHDVKFLDNKSSGSEESSSFSSDDLSDIPF